MRSAPAPAKSAGSSSDARSTANTNEYALGAFSTVALRFCNSLKQDSQVVTISEECCIQETDADKINNSFR